MNINLTLFGQSIAFAVFVWFCMKFIWPPIMNALEQRKKTIADGLAAAERGKKERELGEQRATEVIKAAKGKAAEVIASAEKRGGEIIEQAKTDAKLEGERIVAAAHAEIEQAAQRAREALRADVAALATAGAEQILAKEIDPAVHARMLEELATQL